MSHTKTLSEEFLRRIARENRNGTVQFWENIPEKKQQKILKKKWLPAGVQPIMAELSPLGQMGFVLCTDGVLYGHGVDFWKAIISELRLVGYDYAISIEHEDSLMSSNEGLNKAIACLKEVLIFEDKGEMFWA
jgi:hypothetical protein